MYDSDLDFGMRSWGNYVNSYEYVDENEDDYEYQNDGSNETLKHLNETVDSTLDDDVETDKPPKQKDVTLLRARSRTIHSSKQHKYKCVKHYGREKGRCVKVRCKSMAK